METVDPIVVFSIDIMDNDQVSLSGHPSSPKTNQTSQKDQNQEPQTNGKPKGAKTESPPKNQDPLKTFYPPSSPRKNQNQGPKLTGNFQEVGIGKPFEYIIL